MTNNCKKDDPGTSRQALFCSLGLIKMPPYSRQKYVIDATSTSRRQSWLSNWFRKQFSLIAYMYYCNQLIRGQ